MAVDFSTASSTFFSGSVGIGAISTGLAGENNAQTYLINGTNISNIFATSNTPSNTSNTLIKKITDVMNTKENILTFNSPFSRVNHTISFSYDTNTLGLDVNNNLKVLSGTSSKWTQSVNNI